MSEFTLLTWDGGGNVAVTLAVALALRARGHHVTVAGPESLRHRVESRSVNFVELGISPPSGPRQRGSYLLAISQGTRSMVKQLDRLAQETDVLVIDCNLSWAMQRRAADRTAVLVHSALAIYLPAWQSVLDTANVHRVRRGQPPFPAAAEAWASSDLLLVTSVARFDRPLPGGRLRPIYVGLASIPARQDSRLPVIPPSDGRPRVLVSFSTDRLQESPQRLQRSLDALAGLRVDVLATTSGASDVKRLRVPTNARVIEYVPHDSVMASAALVVCHAGHGTTMAALTHGVPLVCIPGLGRDQEPIAARVNELGLGIALPSDAPTPAIREAAATILAERGYLDRVREFAERTGRPDGAQGAAGELIALAEASC